MIRRYTALLAVVLISVLSTATCLLAESPRTTLTVAKLGQMMNAAVLNAAAYDLSVPVKALQQNERFMSLLVEQISAMNVSDTRPVMDARAKAAKDYVKRTWRDPDLRAAELAEVEEQQDGTRKYTFMRETKDGTGWEFLTINQWPNGAIH